MNFDCRVLRISEVPRIDLQLVKSAQPLRGIGEPGTFRVMPSLTHAILSATGKRVRKLTIGEQCARCSEEIIS